MTIFQNRIYVFNREMSYMFFSYLIDKSDYEKTDLFYLIHKSDFKKSRTDLSIKLLNKVLEKLQPGFVFWIGKCVEINFNPVSTENNAWYVPYQDVQLHVIWGLIKVRKYWNYSAIWKINFHVKQVGLCCAIFFLNFISRCFCITN